MKTKTSIKFACCMLVVCGLICAAAAQSGTPTRNASTGDVINTVIGGGPNNIPGVNANMYLPYQVAVDASGNVYVAGYGLNRVFKISAAGIETVLAGTGTAGYGGDGGLATAAELYGPQGVAVDGASPANVYIADTSNCIVRKVNQTTGDITLVAGTPDSCTYGGDTGEASLAHLNSPSGVAVNPTTDDLYIADYSNGLIRKVAGGAPTGTITTVAGLVSGGTSPVNCGGTSPYGDGSAATSANLCNPDAVTVDNSVSPVNLFITEHDRCDVREVVGKTADIYQVAGSYTKGCGYSGDGAAAVGAQFNQAYQTHVSVAGSTTTVDVGDYGNGRIRQFTITYASNVPTSGNISTIGGKGEVGWCNDDNQSALNVCMGPIGLGYDSSGNYYIGDYGADRVRKVTKSSGFINTIDGWGANGGTQPFYSDPVGLSGVGGTPSLYYPAAVYADPTSSNVYVGGYQGDAVYLWNSTANQISGFAGNGAGGFAGDGSAANSTAAELNQPLGIGKDSSGNIYIADAANCAIREVVKSTGDITTFAGGSPGSLKGCGYTNSSAADSQFDYPYGVVLDSANNLYVADYYNCAIRKITASGSAVSTLAGGLGCGYSGDGGLAANAKLYYPSSIALDAAGNIYFADWNNCRVREIVASTGIIQTVVGDGACGYNGDGPATGTDIYDGYVTVDPNGNIFYADTYNEIVRWITPTSQMMTYAGTPQGAGFSGDGGPALSAKLYYPEGISRDSSGNTYVADYENFRIRQITPFAGYGLSTANVLFETQPGGTTSDFQAITVSGIGPTTISAIAVTAPFSEIDDCVGEALNANQTCEIDVYFAPTAVGHFNGTLTINSNALLAANPNKVVLSGTGSGLSLTGSLAFGVNVLKTPLTKTVTLANTGSTVNLGKIFLTETTDFSFSTTAGTCPLSGGTLAKGTCTINVTFNAQSIGPKKCTLVVPSNDAASPLLAGATATGTEVQTSAASLPFGSISYGTTLTLPLTISNVATTGTMSLSWKLSGTGYEIATTGTTCGSSLGAGANCVLQVEFAPTAVGSDPQTLTLTTNGGSSPVIPLTGTATTDVSATPNPLAFGTITHGTTKSMNVVVKNVGTIASLVVSATQITGTDPSQFTVLSNGCTGGVAPNATCNVSVQFAPPAAASYSATLTLTTNGGQNPAVSLTGTGD